MKSNLNPLLWIIFIGVLIVLFIGIVSIATSDPKVNAMYRVEFKDSTYYTCKIIEDGDCVRFKDVIHNKNYTVCRPYFITRIK